MNYLLLKPTHKIKNTEINQKQLHDKQLDTCLQR